MAKENSSPVYILRELEADIEAKIKVKVKLQNKIYLEVIKIIVQSEHLHEYLGN